MSAPNTASIRPASSAALPLAALPLAALPLAARDANGPALVSGKPAAKLPVMADRAMAETSTVDGSRAATTELVFNTELGADEAAAVAQLMSDHPVVDALHVPAACGESTDALKVTALPVYDDVHPSDAYDAKASPAADPAAPGSTSAAERTDRPGGVDPTRAVAEQLLAEYTRYCFEELLDTHVALACYETAHTWNCFEEATDAHAALVIHTDHLEAEAITTWRLDCITTFAEQAIDTNVDPVAVAHRLRDVVVTHASRMSLDTSLNLLCVISKCAARSQAAQDVFATEAVRDVLVVFMSRAKTADAVQTVSNAIYNIIRESERNARLFATAAMCDVLVAREKYAKTPDAAYPLLVVIDNIVAYSPTKLCILKFARVSVRCVPRVKVAAVGFAVVRNVLVNLAWHASSADEVLTLSNAIFLIVKKSNHARDVFATPEMRDALIALVQHTTTADAVASVSCAVRAIICDSPRNVAVFSTASMRDALVALSSHATTAEAIDAVCGVLGQIIGYQSIGYRTTLHLFATDGIRDALALLAFRACTTYAGEMLSLAFGNVCAAAHVIGHASLLATTTVRDALVSLARLATTPDAVELLSEVIDIIWAIPDAKIVLASGAVRDALKPLKKYATTCTADAALRRTIGALIQRDV